MDKTGIQAAVEAVSKPDQSGTNELARLLGVSRQVIGQWLTAGHAPYGRARQIEMHTGVDRRRLVDPVIRDLFDFEG